MSTQTKLVAPHMSALATISALMADNALNSQTKLQHLIGAAKSIPMMKLQPNHVAEVVAGIDKQIGNIQGGAFQYGKAAVEHLTIVRDQLVVVNKQAQNGHAGAAESSMDAHVGATSAAAS